MSSKFSRAILVMNILSTHGVILQSATWNQGVSKIGDNREPVLQDLLGVRSTIIIDLGIIRKFWIARVVRWPMIGHTW